MNSKTLQLRKKLLIQKKAFRFKTIEIPYENSNANDERLTSYILSNAIVEEIRIPIAQSFTMLKKSMTLL